MQKELKTALVIGGNGALGKQVIKTFQTLKPFWRIFSIDLTINKEADKNIIIGKNFDKSSIPDIKKSIESNFDCIINVAGGWSGDNLNNEDILVSTQLMHHQNVTSSVLSTYLARNYLNKKGLLIFTGAAAVYDNQNTNMLAYQLAKNSVHYLTELLVQNPQELPEDTKIITLLPYFNLYKIQFLIFIILLIIIL